MIGIFVAWAARVALGGLLRVGVGEGAAGAIVASRAFPVAAIGLLVIVAGLALWWAKETYDADLRAEGVRAERQRQAELTAAVNARLAEANARAAGDLAAGREDRARVTGELTTILVPIGVPVPAAADDRTGKPAAACPDYSDAVRAKLNAIQIGGTRK